MKEICNVPSADGNGGGGGRPLFPQWSHHVYPQFLPGSHPNANANANHHISQHHHQHPLPAARHTNRQTQSGYYLPNHHSNHYNHHPNNYNYHRHHYYHHHNNNNHHHSLQKHNDQPRNIYHRNSGVGMQGNLFHLQMLNERKKKVKNFEENSLCNTEWIVGIIYIFFFCEHFPNRPLSGFQLCRFYLSPCDDGVLKSSCLILVAFKNFSMSLLFLCRSRRLYPTQK